jgi:hydrogenase maturation factor
MCVGSIARLVETWEEGELRLGQLDDGCVVPLTFVPEARPGAQLLLHLGVPVEVLDPDTARDALALRASAGLDPNGGAP